MKQIRSTPESKKTKAAYEKKKKDYYREKDKECKRKFRENNPLAYKIIEKFRHRVLRALSSKNPSNKRIIETVGCTPLFLKEYLESKFSKGMTWNNRHKWHIDHILPISSFDLSLKENQEKCFHYTNMQPLWAADNIRKSNKVDFSIVPKPLKQRPANKKDLIRLAVEERFEQFILERQPIRKAS